MPSVPVSELWGLWARLLFSLVSPFFQFLEFGLTHFLLHALLSSLLPSRAQMRNPDSWACFPPKFHWPGLLLAEWERDGKEVGVHHRSAQKSTGNGETGSFLNTPLPSPPPSCGGPSSSSPTAPGPLRKSFSGLPWQSSG